MVAEDASGLGVAGTGLADLYALDSGVTPLLDPEHPLLGIRGVPLDPPGVFTPHSPPALLVAGAASGALDPGPTGSWLEACGQRSGGLP
jgi:hypothetical protein